MPMRHRRAILSVLVLAVIGMAAWYAVRQRAAVRGPVTFTRDVAPIVFTKCAPCHHPGEAAPFSLLTYDDVRHRARQIVDVTQKRFMPPWLPAEGHDLFADSRRLSDAELQTIQEWVAAGTLAGDAAELPPAPVFADGWQNGPPDLILESPSYTLTSTDRDVFRNFVVPIPLDTPRWVRSIELRPDNPRVTHHARLGVDSTNESIRRDAEDPEPGYAGMAWAQDPDGQLVIWAPGLIADPGTDSVAWRLVPKSALVLHTHMQPTGKTEVVKFRIGIHFAKDPPRQHPAMLRIGSSNIDIPAGAKNHTVSDKYVLPIDVDVHLIFPHAHSLCTELQVHAERPDGSRQALITIPRFDENWHDAYRYRQPVRLPRGTRILSKFAYDNSADNIRNRNQPPRRVGYGSNATDEMADVYLQVTPVHVDQRAVLMEDYKQYELQSQIVGHRKTLELDPGNIWSQEALAACYIGSGKPGEAIAILEQRLNAGPESVSPVVSLGMAYQASGDAVRAEAQFRRALARDAKYPLAWFGLGQALAAQKQSESAEHAYRQAVLLSPGLLDAHINLADLLIARGQLDPAAVVCTSALGDSPKMAKIYLKLAEISAKRKHYDESLKYCGMAQQLAPYTHPPKVLLAVFCFANGDPQLGLKLLRDARAESPVHPMPALILGQFARQQQQWPAAREQFTAAASLPIPANWPASHRKRFLILLNSESFQLAQQLQDSEYARLSLAKWMQAEPENRKLQALYDALPPEPDRSLER